MAKVNSVTKHADWGHRWMVSKHKDRELIATTTDPDHLAKCVEAIKQGHSIFEDQLDTNTSAFYKTKRINSSIVDLEYYLQHNPWKHGLHLDNSVDHAQWCLNVDLYFEHLMQDDVFKTKANALRTSTDGVRAKSGKEEDEFSLREALVGEPFVETRKTKVKGQWMDKEVVVHSAKSWLKDQVPSKAGSTGKRPQHIVKWLLNPTPPPGRKTGIPMGWIPRKVHEYLRYNRGWA